MPSAACSRCSGWSACAAARPELRALLLLLGASALGPAALAAREPGDYRQELFDAAASQAEALNAEGRLDEAIAFGARFQDRVAPAAVVAYEVAFAYNTKGELDKALDHYGRALELDPQLATALYDRGEIYLSRDQDALARADFEAAAEVRGDHWAVHFRLAELAARRGDSDAFEDHLLDAVKNGFDFRTIVRDPSWQQWSRDPALGTVIGRLVTVYSDEGLLKIMRGE